MSGASDHARLRLPAKTRSGEVGMVRADLDRIERRSLFREQRLHPLVDAPELLAIDDLARDRRLVRHQHESETGGVQAPQRLPRAGNERDLRRIVDVRDRLQNRSVPIEEDGGTPAWSFLVRRPHQLGQHAMDTRDVDSGEALDRGGTVLREAGRAVDGVVDHALRIPNRTGPGRRGRTVDPHHGNARRLGEMERPRIVGNGTSHARQVRERRPQIPLSRSRAALPGIERLRERARELTLRLASDPEQLPAVFDQPRAQLAEALRRPTFGLAVGGPGSERDGALRPHPRADPPQIGARDFLDGERKARFAGRLERRSPQSPGRGLGQLVILIAEMARARAPRHWVCGQDAAQLARPSHPHRYPGESGKQHRRKRRRQDERGVEAALAQSARLADEVTSPLAQAQRRQELERLLHSLPEAPGARRRL